MKFTDLLENYIVLKERNQELFYDIKDNVDYYNELINDILSYNLYVKDDFIKLEKIPVEAESWMGIGDFSDVKEYIFFLLILMFLEDKNKGEQFILSNITEYIEHNYPEETIEWTVFKNRKSLITVLKLCIKIGIIMKNDGEEDNFIKDEGGEVLYESTGISKYIVRRFSKEIKDDDTFENLLDESWEGIDKNKGVIRKNRVFRNLILTPVVYNTKENEADYEYIKHYRSYIKNIFEKYLQWDVHIHRDAALAVVKNSSAAGDTFPNKRGESTIALFVNKKILNMIENGELIIGERDNIELSKEDFNNILLSVRCEDGHGFTKSFRDCSEAYYLESITSFMEEYSLIKVKEDSVFIMPLSGKIIGRYPDDYKGGES